MSTEEMSTAPVPTTAVATTEPLPDLNESLLDMMDGISKLGKEQEALAEFKEAKKIDKNTGDGETVYG